MESLYLLIPVALIFILVAVKVFFWAVNSGQYDDLNTEAHRILFEDDAQPAKPQPAQTTPAEEGSTEDKP